MAENSTKDMINARGLRCPMPVLRMARADPRAAYGAPQLANPQAAYGE